MAGIGAGRGLGLALLLALSACGSGRPGAPASADPVPAKICGMFDRDRVVALGIPRERIGASGALVARAARLERDVACTIRDTEARRQVVKVVIGDLDPGQVKKATGDLDEEYHAKHNAPGGLVCSRPEALNSVGTGYACRGTGLVTVAAVVPGRLVRLTYRPVLEEPHAAAFARAIGLIGNLQENVVAFDQEHASSSPGPSS